MTILRHRRAVENDLLRVRVGGKSRLTFMRHAPDLQDGKRWALLRVSQGGMTFTILQAFSLRQTRALVAILAVAAFLLGALAGAAIYHRISTDPPRAEVSDAQPATPGR